MRDVWHEIDQGLVPSAETQQQPAMDTTTPPLDPGSVTYSV
jgi:hypothetical protein